VTAAPTAGSTADPAIEVYRQADFQIRFDWGLTGAAAISTGADVTVVVDVLSFTTTVSVAVDSDVEVFPYRFRDASAAAFAAARSAVLAVGRSERKDTEISLSPLSVRDAAQPGGLLSATPRLVLPSPNGSAISRQLAERGSTVVVACLRNATAVASWINRQKPAVVAVIAAGERWPGDTLRPAVEDLWGAGAVITGLIGSRSPEAGAAAAAWAAVADTIGPALLACGSGRELAALGWGDEVPVAAEVDESSAVPVLVGESIRAV
jgi:2-phosphosulfolactate phosphatase